MEFKHIPVMLDECISGLNIKPEGIYVDGTLGGAGHSNFILKKLNKKGMLIGIDRDQEALNAAQEILKKYNNVKYVHGNHDNIIQILEDLGIEQVDGILLDLGISSYQIDNGDRGFSYMQDSKLDMRMDRSQDLTAMDVINKYSEEDLANIIFRFGEEKFARRIARNICEKRKLKPIETTFELVDIIKESVPFAPNDGHPAKRTFQAIRIEVNSELKPLYDTICDSIKVLKPEGRLCVITFHSLEDGIVKQAMQDLSGKCICPPGLPYCVCGAKSFGKIITKKPIIPTEKECSENSRSKSAKLRIFEKNKEIDFGQLSI